MLRCLAYAIPPTRTWNKNGAMSDTVETTYAVEGMTCDHCRTAVAEEVEQVGGVAGVEVDLHTGGLVIRGRDFSDAGIRDAVDRAGYRVAGA